MKRVEKVWLPDINTGMDPAKQEILEILSQAELVQVQTGNYDEAMIILCTAADKIPYMKQKHEQASIRNATQNNEEQMILYLSKRGNILYEIGEYEIALESYTQIQSEIPGNCKVYKAQGDCYRKMGNYEEAVYKYEVALSKYENDPSSSKSDKAAILNSKGLVELSIAADLLDEEHLNNALNLFKDAIKLNPNNPLYYCNQGKALYSLGSEDEAITVFNKASKLLESGTIGEELSKDNIVYINNTLSTFIKQVENLHNIILSKKDSVILKREAQFIDKAIEGLEKPTEDIDLEYQKLIATKKKLQIIESSNNLNEYYDGFIFNVNQAYSTAMIVNSDKLSINTSNILADGTGLLISFIPLVGENISKGVKAIKEFVITVQVKQSAANICKFARGITEFESLAQDAILDVIIDKKNELEIIDPEKYVLKAWSDKFIALVKDTKEDLNAKLYGTRYETPMQKLGYKDSCDLVQKIGAGMIYAGETAVRIRAEEKINRLQEQVSAIIDKEMEDWQKKHVPITSEENNKCCTSCNIFMVTDIKYDNELLNHPKILSQSLNKYSLLEILNLSVNIDPQLINNAIDSGNSELLLAGLISVDESESIIKIDSY